MNSLTPQSQHALFPHIDRIQGVRVKLGTKVTNIAIDQPDLEKLTVIVELLAANFERPGAFAEYIINEVRKVDGKGRSIALVRTGLVKTALIEWSERNRDLTRSWSKKDMGVALNQDAAQVRALAASLTRICKSIGIKAGSDGKGGFRIYDLKELAKKQNRRAQVMQAIQRGGESDAKLLNRSGYHPKGKVVLQPNYWQIPESNE